MSACRVAGVRLARWEIRVENVRVSLFEYTGRPSREQGGGSVESHGGKTCTGFRWMCGVYWLQNVC